MRVDSGWRWILGLAVALWSLLVPAVRCSRADESSEDVIRTIQHGVAHRQELIASLSGWATVRRHCPSADEIRAAVAALRAADPGHPPAPVTADAEALGNCELVRIRFCWSDDCWRIDSAKVVSAQLGEWTLLGPGSGWRDAKGVATQWVSVSDGEDVLALNTSLPQAMFAPLQSSEARLGRSSVVQLRRILMLDPVSKPADEVVRLGAPRLAGRETLGGVECYVSESRFIAPQTEHTVFVRVWCAASLGFAPVRVENVLSYHSDPTRGLARRVAGSDWHEVARGVWMPGITRWEEYSYTPRRRSFLSDAWEAQVEYETANTDIRSQCTFPQLPIGTRVVDLRPGAEIQQYVVGDTDRVLAGDKGTAGLEGTPDWLKGMPDVGTPE